MMRVRCKRRRTGDGGTAAVEFAGIAPFLILLMVATFELGRAIQSVSAVNKLASQYAIAWSDCTDEPVGTCKTEMALYTNPVTIANLAPQLSNPTVQMFQVTMNGTTPTVLYSSGGVLTSSQIAAAQSVLQTSGQSGVIVTVTYNFQVLPIFTNFLPSGLPHTSQTMPMSYTIVQLKA